MALLTSQGRERICALAAPSSLPPSPTLHLPHTAVNRQRFRVLWEAKSIMYHRGLFDWCYQVTPTPRAIRPRALGGSQF